MLQHRMRTQLNVHCSIGAMFTCVHKLSRFAGSLNTRGQDCLQIPSFIEQAEQTAPESAAVPTQASKALASLSHPFGEGREQGQPSGP